MSRVTVHYFSDLRILLILFILFTLGCSNDPDAQHTTGNQITDQEIREPMEKVNRYLVRKEEDDIQDLVKRYGWEMQKSATGLRYLVYKKGLGQAVKEGNLVSISYEVKLLDGSTVYSSSTLGLKQFRVGKGGVEAGLEEGILLLNEGDRAKFIIPSHLAFGLLGDGNNIPPRASLVYDIEVVRVN